MLDKGEIYRSYASLEAAQRETTAGEAFLVIDPQHMEARWPRHAGVKVNDEVKLVCSFEDVEAFLYFLDRLGAQYQAGDVR